MGHKYIRTPATLTLALALGALSGCSNKNSSPENSILSTPLAVKVIPLTPNMSGFLEPGSSSHCFNGGLRPCAILIRTYRIWLVIILMLIQIREL